MRSVTLLILLVFASSVQAQGFLDSIRRRVNDTVNNAVDEVRSITNQEIDDANRDVSQSTDGLVDDVIPQVPANAGVSIPPAVPSGASSSGQTGVLSNTLYWGTPSGNDLLASEQEIQGLRIGMPAMDVDQALTERGYESNTPQQYFKRQLTDDGRVIRTQRVRYLTVQPSREFIDELEEGALKNRVLEAQRTGSGNLELVYVILYEQIYNQEVRQFDADTMIGQARAAFGPSTFPDDVLRNGMAFRTSPDTTLMYHDASLLSIDFRNSLVESVPERGMGHREAVFNALRAPCGGPENPWGAPGGGGCPNGWLDAIPDDFDRQLELARAVLSPYMRIKLTSSGAGIETRLEWSYLQSERGMRERNAEKAARDSAPAAELDF